MTALIETEAALIDQMTTPTQEVREAVSRLPGPVLILGAAGKMGPTLAELLVRAGAPQVIGVSRFSDQWLRDYLTSTGVRTVQADLLDPQALAALPEAPCIFLLAGFKFGASGDPSLTWAMNTYLPAQVVQRFPRSRIVYVSSGNVYAYTAATGTGAREEDEVGPVGEYAQSRLGGERLAQFMATRQGTPLAIVRLFYATELRYGILHDLAWKIWQQEPIALSMGQVNQLWQGDANAYLCRLFPLCESPPAVINMTGPETLSVRQLALELGATLGKEPIFTGQESETALLGDASRFIARFGPPSVSIPQIIQWLAHWVKIGGPSLGKPTKYESRSGKF
ncbi:MAG: NAD(P)-dependent oxidoreductase [Candidatus Latescibacteria bacterium]|nr:NAD(P)-dependent oxidoreductase [Candidatus Latescibacterota bacterium]